MSPVASAIFTPRPPHRCTPPSLSQIDPKAKKTAKLITKGLPASPGAAVGQIVFTAEEAVAWAQRGLKVVLVREETSPEDITGMAAAEGILTSRGGQTSHAAVVARGMNKCCVAGAGALHVDAAGKVVKVEGPGHLTYKEGDWITLDGSTGESFEGKVAVVAPQVAGEFESFLKLCDSVAQMSVRANADTPKDAKIALGYGAKGIGLVRTEHMFFDPARLPAVRRMILSETTEQRVAALDRLLPFQRDDFTGILGSMTGLPVVIRLIDPPLHEFLPSEKKDIDAMAADMGVPSSTVQNKVNSMKEFNPMLGFRGCRLGIVYPEINEMQVTAIFQASLALVAQGKDPRPCIEIPLVGNLGEYAPLKKMIQTVARRTGAEGKVKYEIGTMIEVPRAALQADKLAAEADFFSFGTNDLTQMTCGFSRDDAAIFLKEYVKQGQYCDPRSFSLSLSPAPFLATLFWGAMSFILPHLAIQLVPLACFLPHSHRRHLQARSLRVDRPGGRGQTHGYLRHPRPRRAPQDRHRHLRRARRRPRVDLFLPPHRA